MNIYVLNRSTVLSDATVKSWIPTFQTYTSHVRAWWPRPCTIIFASTPPTNSWQLVFLDDSDQAGALGYHDFTPGGKPVMRVFAKTDLDYGYSPTVTATHELAETLADPYISTAEQVTNTKFYAREVGDPVEADSLGYRINDVLVSDFIYPAWFIPGQPGPYDRGKHCTAPLQVLPGGYMSVFVSGQGWTQVNARGERVKLDPGDPRFRDRG